MLYKLDNYTKVGYRNKLLKQRLLRRKKSVCVCVCIYNYELVSISKFV